MQRLLLPFSGTFRFFALYLLAGGLALAWAPLADAAQLRLLALECRITQEKDSDGDELRLEVKFDTGNTLNLRRNGMKKGMAWVFDFGGVDFYNSVSLRLTEIDTYKDGIYAGDETLGNHTILATEPTFKTLQKVFNGHGAQYVLTYQIYLAPPREIELVSLQCITTQEKDSNGDELRFRVKAQGKSEFTLSKNGIKAGQTWAINRKVQFIGQIRLQLVENDGFGINFRDENLGTHTLKAIVPNPGPTPNQTLTFTGHGARYILTYRFTK